MTATPSSAPGGSSRLRAARVLAALALACALFSLLLVWLLLEPELRHYPTLLLLASTAFLLAPPLGLAALLLGRRSGPRGRPGFWAALGAFGTWILVLVLIVPGLFIGGRGPARNRAALSNLQSGLEELASTYQATRGLGEPDRLQALEGWLASQQQLRNPWSRRPPAQEPSLTLSAPGATAAAALARQRSTVLGQAVFVVSAPSEPNGARWLAGAVKLLPKAGRLPVTADESGVVVQVLQLEP